MTAGGAPIFADSAPDSSHMCSPLEVGCRKSSRDSRSRRTTSLERVELLQGSSSSSPLSSSRCKSSSNPLFLVSLFLCLLLSVQSQSVDEFRVDRTALNQQIQTAAFQSFPRRVVTGTVYNVSLPGNLSAVVDVQMVRFRTGRLRRYGFQFQQVNLPVGIKVEENLRHVVLVYRYFKDFNFHSSIPGTEFAAPVVGVLVYNGSNLTNLAPLPELKVITTARPIEVRADNLNNNPNPDVNVTCVLFDDTGLVVSNFTSSPSAASNTCTWTTLGDFALLAPRIMESSGGSSNNAWKIAVGAVAGAIVLLVLLSLLALVAVRYRQRAKFTKMERAADHGETLHHTLIGCGRAPAAASTRTKPVLESDYVS